MHTQQHSFVPRHVFMQYHKQLVTSRTLAFHQQTLRMADGEDSLSPAEKRQLVIKKVARELWINFTSRGQNTPMLRHMCAALREEYGEDLEFEYEPGGFELYIMRRTPLGLIAVDNNEKITLINRAWKIALQVVDSYIH